MPLNRLIPLLLAVLLPLPAAAGSLYPMEGGSPRRENRNLAPSPLTLPFKTQWLSKPCLPLKDPVSNPVVLSDKVVQSFQKGVRCYDRVTGDHLWTWLCDYRTQIWNAPCYDADRDRLYVGCFNGDTLALDAGTGTVLWAYAHRPSSFPAQTASPLYVGGKLYVGNGGSGFLCLDPDTRQVVWELDFVAYFSDSIPRFIGTPAYDGGSIYLPTHGGDLFSLDAVTGSVQWYVKQNLVHENGLLVSDEYVYTLGKLSQVECRRRSDGSLAWAADTHIVKGHTNGNLALCGDILVVPGDSWVVWGLNRHTGAKVWNTRLSGNFALNSPIVVCGKVYISGCHGNYYRLDGQTGQVEWKLYHGAHYTFVGWAEADGQLFVANKTGRMVCFTSETPGDPADCVCDLVPSLPPGYVPSPTPTSSTLENPNCVASATPTATSTRTGTPTPTPTGTLTPADPGTPTPTPTGTFTPTGTVTPPSPEAPTPTPTGTLTPVDTYTPTPSGTPSATPSPSPSQTSSPTATRTATLTSTPSQTDTPTPEATDTPTPSPTSTPHRVCDPRPYPNPSRDGKVRFRVAGGPYDDIRVKVYTPGFRKVCAKRHACNNLAEESVELELKDDQDHPLANGLYYLKIETEYRGTVREYVRRCVVAR